jgi:hypothetical protein
MKIKKTLTLMILVVIVNMFFASCNDAPTEVGTSFLQDTISVDIVGGTSELLPTTSTYTISKYHERNTGSMLVGETDKIKAASLMRFNVPTNRNQIAEEDIKECKLYITPQKYAIGDTAGSNQLNFEIKEVTHSWSSDSIDYQDVFYSDILFENAREIGKWSGQINRTVDTIEPLIFDFPSKICYEWFQKINDGLNITDTIWGISILPSSGSTIINNFRSFSNYSATSGSFIRVFYYKDTAQTILDSFDMVTAEDCSVVESKETDDKNDLVIQGGVRKHSRIDFDISSIPLLACINYAELVLTINEEKSYSGNVALPEMVSLQYFADTTVGEKLIQRVATIIGYLDSTNHTFVFKNYLNAPMNKILRDGGKGTLVLTFQSEEYEYNQLGKYVFYGLNASDQSKRPKFRFVYSNM